MADGVGFSYTVTMDFRLLYVTVGKREEALHIARTIVDERLAACANVIDGMESLYWWQGKLTQDREVVVILKTRASLVDAATARIRSLHSYAVPCVVVLPILGGNPAYLEWLAGETLTETELPSSSA